jgi:hypothetical protein
MTMISKPLKVVMAPFSGKTRKSGARSAPAAAASATPTPKASMSSRSTSTPAV